MYHFRHAHLDRRLDAVEPVRCQSVGNRSLDELEISERSEVDGQISQGLVGLVDDEYVCLRSGRAL